MNKLYEETFLETKKRPIDFLDTLLALHKVNEDNEKISFHFILEDEYENLEQTDINNFQCGNIVVYIEFEKRDLPLYILDYEEDYLHIKGAIYNCWQSACEENGETDGDVMFFEERYDREPYFWLYEYDYHKDIYEKEEYINGDHLIRSAYVFKYALKQIESFMNKYKDLVDLVYGDYSYLDNDIIKNFKMYEYLEKKAFCERLQSKYPEKNKEGLKKI